jgi:hypothetical protein
MYYEENGMYVVETPYTRRLFENAKASITMIKPAALNDAVFADSESAVIIDDMYNLFTTSQLALVNRLHGIIITKNPAQYTAEFNCLSVFQSKQQILASIFGAKRMLNVFVGDRTVDYNRWIESCFNYPRLDDKALFIDLDPYTIIHAFSNDKPDDLWTFHQGLHPPTAYVKTCKQYPQKILALTVTAPEFADMTDDYFEEILNVYRQLYDIFYLCYLPKHSNEMALLRTADSIYKTDATGAFRHIHYEDWLNESI